MIEHIRYPGMYTHITCLFSTCIICRCRQQHESSEIADGPHMYEQVDLLLPETDGDPTNRNATRPYQQEDSPLLLEQEGGVTQSVDQQVVTEVPIALEKSLIQNPFYQELDESRDHIISDYENHELEKIGGGSAAVETNMSSEEVQLLEGVINFYKPEDIEGEVIEEVDYQNVTVVRTRIRSNIEESQSKNGSQNDPDLAVSTIAVHQQENATSLGWNRNGTTTVATTKQQNTTINNHHGPGEIVTAGDSHNNDSSDESYADVTSLVSSEFYQNFEPIQCDTSVLQNSQVADETLEEYKQNSREGEDDDYDEVVSNENFYINISSRDQGHSMRGSIADEDASSLNYQNVSPHD